jgi:hypothetical protein
VSFAVCPGEYSGETNVHDVQAVLATTVVDEPVSTTSANVWLPIDTIAV